MKLTVSQHLQDIEDVEAREKALANLDKRYALDEVYTLQYALMLGVYQTTEADKKFWREFADKNSTYNK